MASTQRKALGSMMDRYLDGEPRAFRELYVGLGPRLRRQVSTLVSDRAAIDDVVQLVFMHAHAKRDTFEWPDGDRSRAVVAWYSAIARNRAIDYLRRRNRHAGRTTPIDDGSSLETRSIDQRDARDQEELLLEREATALRIDQVRSAVNRLPPGQREVVELHKFRGMSMDEISEQTGVRAGTLRVRAHRAYRTLAAVLSPVAHATA